MISSTFPLNSAKPLTSPTQCSLLGKLNRPALHLGLLGIALPIRVEFRLQFGQFRLKLVEMSEAGIAFCLEWAVSKSEINRTI